MGNHFRLNSNVKTPPQMQIGFVFEKKNEVNKHLFKSQKHSNIFPRLNVNG